MMLLLVRVELLSGFNSPVQGKLSAQAALFSILEGVIACALSIPEQSLNAVGAVEGCYGMIEFTVET